MSQPLSKTDPVCWMLEKVLSDPSWRSHTDVYDKNCYICTDSGFSMMGLPLCYPCKECGGHVPVDDTICTDCGFDNSTGSKL